MIVVSHPASCLIPIEISPVQFSNIYMWEILMVQRAMVPTLHVRQIKSLAEYFFMVEIIFS